MGVLRFMPEWRWLCDIPMGDGVIVVCSIHDSVYGYGIEEMMRRVASGRGYGEVVDIQVSDVLANGFRKC